MIPLITPRVFVFCGLSDLRELHTVDLVSGDRGECEADGDLEGC